MIGIIFIFLLMISVRLTTSLELGCWGTLGYAVLFSGMIFHQLMEFKKDVSSFACPACLEGSLCQKFCKSRVVYALIAVTISSVMAVSLLSFLVLTEKFFLLIIGMDMFAFFYISTLSLFPMTAITLLYKFGIKTQLKLSPKNKKES